MKLAFKNQSYILTEPQRIRLAKIKRLSFELFQSAYLICASLRLIVAQV